MTLLRSYSEASSRGGIETQDRGDITAILARVGIDYRRWPTRPEFESADDEAVLAAYRPELDAFGKGLGLCHADIVSLSPDASQREALRQRFCAEHTHNDFEVRFFIAGSGLFYIHVDGRVHGLFCESGDFISIPAGTPHWFDMGEWPDFRCIRLFSDPEGWVARYTGDDIASRFPDYAGFLETAPA